MKHFLLEGEHIVPFEERAPALIAAHRAFLEEGYRKGWFLFSGPTIPAKGGFLVARASSLKALSDMLAEEPYVKENVMRFRRVTEFFPAQNAPILNNWFQKTTYKEKSMTLPEKLAAFRTTFEETVHSVYLFGVVETMHRATDELVSTGAADKALKVGDRAPSFALKNVDGQEISSRDLLAEGPLVVTFYRGFWCPYCNMDLQALQEALPAIKEQGAQLVAISPQTQSNGEKAQRQNKVTFPILSDPGNEVAAEFGLRFKLPDYLTRLYLDGFQLDLSHVNGDSSWTLPMPARYVIGTDGVIIYAEVSPDHTDRPDPSELLPVLSATGNRSKDNAVKWAQRA